MKFIVGTKQEMTQLLDEGGRAYPATVLKAAPVTVTLARTKERDGYEALQVGFGTRGKHRINKAQRGHFKDLGNFKGLKEYRLSKGEEASEAVGSVIDVSVFSPGERVEVSAVSKGKGFQGVVKRHKFSGGPRTHGQKHSEREPGSIGGGGRAGGRVIKGMRMAGRMGGDRVTLKNVLVLSVNKERHELILKGAVPGRRGTQVEVRGIS